MNAQLHQWLAKNLDRLKAKNVEVDVRIPKSGDDFVGTAAIGFLFRNVILEFAVWDRTPCETSVIVSDMDLREEIFVKDSFSKLWMALSHNSTN